jgi:hypothetical protein
VDTKQQAGRRSGHEVAMAIPWPKQTVRPFDGRFLTKTADRKPENDHRVYR